MIIQDANKEETLQVLLRYSSAELNDTLVWSYNQQTVEWIEGQIELRSILLEEKYVNWKINIVASKPGDFEAFVAIDDFAFRASDICEMLPPDASGGSTTTPTQTPECPEVTCGDGQCKPASARCNFVFDCPGDTADEDGCPQFQDFESCHDIEDCHWTGMTSEGMRWVRTSGREVGLTSSGSGPLADFANDTSGHFLYILADHTSSQHAFAQVATPAYQNSASECFFNFYVYLENGDPANYPSLVPKMSHIELGYVTVLDTINLGFVEPGTWEKLEIGIGRHRDHFKIIFSLSNDGVMFKAGVAVDEVSFFDCQPPPAQESCLDTEFHCQLTKGCVFTSKICDYQDDCGDDSDEIDCGEFLRTNFEDDAHPLGFFTQGEGAFAPGDFVWQRGNGTTNNQGTGPPFDHTTFSPTGHYLFIDSMLATIGDFAWLWSPTILPSSKDCSLRLFSHMHGRGVGNLTFYNR